MLALLDFVNEFSPYELGPSGHPAVGFRPQIQALHEIVHLAGRRVLELTVELGRADQFANLIGTSGATMENWHGLDSRAVESFKSRREVKEHLASLVIDVKLK